MSVSALISQFSKTSSVSDSPPHSPEVSTRSRRHYSTSSVGSSRSESPASCDTHRPDGAPTRHMSVGASSSSNSTKRGLTSITEDKIRMFNSRCKSNNEECTDGPPQRGKRAGAKRQMSAGCTKSGRETEVVKVVPRRQLSAPGMETRGRSPSPFRLPGMASTVPSSSDDTQETDIDETIDSLQSNDPALTQLNLNNHTRLDTALISQLLEGLHGNTHLQTLSMANIRFTEDHAKELADILRTNTSLTVLNLESNRITRKGITAIMKALAENKQTVVSELRLANQYFAGGAGAEADIAKHLEKITSIIRLGYNFTSPSIRTRIDRYMMRNTDLIRQKRASLTV